MLVDYHLHTTLCGHASGELEEYVRAASRKGLKEIGFSDHIILHIDNRDYSMPLSHLPNYIDAIHNLQSRFTEPRIKLGVEVDYSPDVVEEIDRTLNETRLDYVLGSVHTIRGWVFDDERYIAKYRNEDIGNLWKEYFKLVREAASTGLFDIMAHPDVIKKFGYKPNNNPYQLYVETVDAFKEAGVCVEVNTSGLRKPVHEVYPSPAFLDLCLKERLPITIGSDAHRPEEVGMDFETILPMLRTIGYEKVTTFSDRKRTSIPLECDCKDLQ